MLRIHAVDVLFVWFGLAVATCIMQAQSLQPASGSPGESGSSAASAPSPNMVVRHQPEYVPIRRTDSWWWVHSGVTMQLAGTFSDWATSWKQPEGNQWLAQSGGAYAGKFYRAGTAKKFGLAVGLSVVSYAVAWKWPKTRRFIGVFNMTMGGAFAAAAVRNAVENPYYKQ